MEVSIEGTCVVIRMNNGENRINPKFVEAFNRALDQALSYDAATCLITIGDGKYYSNGLDLTGMGNMSFNETYSFTCELHKLFARHAYAGGALLALAHDHVMMRTEKGWFCLPEIHLRLQFSSGLIDLAKTKIPQSEHTRAILFGHKYTPEEAKSAGVVKECHPIENLKEKAINVAKALSQDSFNRNTLSLLKRDLYNELYISLVTPVKFYSRL